MTAAARPAEPSGATLLARLADLLATPVVGVADLGTACALIRDATGGRALAGFAFAGLAGASLITADHTGQGPTLPAGQVDPDGPAKIAAALGAPPNASVVSRSFHEPDAGTVVYAVLAGAAGPPPQAVVDLLFALALRVGARRLRHISERIFNESADATAIVDADCTFVRVNAAWETLLGWPLEVLRAKTLPWIIHRMDWDAAEACRNKALANLPETGAELRFRHADGGVRWVRWSTYPIEPGIFYCIAIDITAEKTARAELERELRLRQLAEACGGAGTWRRELATNDIFWSPPMFQIVGVDPADGVPKRAELAARYAPEDRAEVMGALDAMAASDEPIAVTGRYLRPDGALRWIEMRGAVERDADGQPIATIGTSIDVTERAERIARLESAEKLLRVFIDQAPIHVSLWDKDMRFIHASRRWHMGNHQPADQSKGVSFWDVYPAAPEHWRAGAAAALRGEVARTPCPELFRTRDQRDIWVTWEMSPWRDETGAICGVVVYSDDVSTLVRHQEQTRIAEERWALALEAAQAGVMDFDLVNKRVTCSPLMEIMLARLGLPVPKSAHDTTALIDPEHRAGVRDVFDVAVGSGEPMEVEHPLVAPRPDAPQTWIHSRMVAQHAPDGTPTRLIAFISDITARKAAEERLIEAERAAHAASEAKSEFLAVMSHELRTPLNGVMGLVQLARRETDPVQLQDYLSKIDACGASLLHIINDVVDLRKIEAGRVELEQAAFSPQAAIGTVCQAFAPAARDRGLEFRTEGVQKLPALVMGDVGRLRQILYNLVSNAVKFTAAGSITVRTQWRSDSLMHGVLRVEVADTGIGLDADAQARLFQRFQQADASISRRFGGAGLGLAISRQLVELMGGTIGVASAPGAGATFFFELPLAVGFSPDPRALAALDPPPPVPGPAARGPARVLVAEDNAVNRLVITKILSSAGHDVACAEDGRQAVAAVAAGDFDVVLMDIRMPGMDGYAAARAIRALPGPAARLPIVAVTADVMEASRQEAQASGIDGFIAKPIDISALLAAIEGARNRATSDPSTGMAPPPA